MKLGKLCSVGILVFLVFLLVIACAERKPVQTVDADQLGLNKESVFSDPDPIVAASAGVEPGENELLGAYFSASPPSISHDIEGLVPITFDSNLCMDCHDLFDEIGNETGPREPTPMPASHYTDLRRNPDEVTSAMIGARYVCTQCHAPLTDAAPVVANTYSQ